MAPFRCDRFSLCETKKSLDLGMPPRNLEDSTQTPRKPRIYDSSHIERVPLLQLAVFRLGLLQETNVGVDLFPNREESLVCGPSLCDVVLRRRCATEPQMSKRAKGAIGDSGAPIDKFLKFCGGLGRRNAVRRNKAAGGITLRPRI
jgi:hypothetical protein